MINLTVSCGSIRKGNIVQIVFPSIEVINATPIKPLICRTLGTLLVTSIPAASAWMPFTDKSETSPLHRYI